MAGTPGRLTAAVALLTCGLASACDFGPDRPGPIAPTPIAPPPPPVVNTLDGLDGDYTLTIDIPDACGELPDVARRRTYAATLGRTNFSYLTIRIIGQGYLVPTVTGDMWNAGTQRVSVDWNNFDIGGCDGFEESLPDGGSLMLCGEGLGTVDGTTITVPLLGRIFKSDEGGRRQICTDTYTFTFRRIPANDAPR